VGVSSAIGTLPTLNPTVLPLDFNVQRFLCIKIVYGVVRAYAMPLDPFWRIVNCRSHPRVKDNLCVDVLEFFRLGPNSKRSAFKCRRENTMETFLSNSRFCATLVLPNGTPPKCFASHDDYSNFSKSWIGILSALANFAMLRSVIFFSPRSIIPTYVR
jgi:hypothetical protein